MDAGESCPKRFDSTIWKKLERTRACPSHTEKLERIKHANRCKITLGRTGPHGEEGIRKLLQLQEGVSLDYNEIFIEMQRDKGYGGRAIEKKALKKALVKVGIEYSEEEVTKSLPNTEDIEGDKSKHGSTIHGSNAKAVLIENEYVKSLHSKIAELEAQILKDVLVN